MSHRGITLHKTLTFKMEKTTQKTDRTAYYQKHKAEVKQKALDYYYANRETILNKKDKKTEKANNATYYQQNRERILEKAKNQRKNKHTCECGGIFNDANKSIHIRSVKHLRWFRPPTTDLKGGVGA